jgi:O-glycosyl hydrolase
MTPPPRCGERRSGNGQLLPIRATGLHARIDCRQPALGCGRHSLRDPSSNALVIVAINGNTSSTNLPVFISSSPPCKLIPWETSASKSLVRGAAVTVANGRVSLPLDGQSVTTFVGMP